MYSFLIINYLITKSCYHFLGQLIVVVILSVWQLIIWNHDDKVLVINFLDKISCFKWVKDNSIVFKLFISIIIIINSLVGNLLLSSGPPCLVTTIIPSTPQQTTQAMKGTCYSSLSCRHFGGVPIGKCGSSNVCCVCKLFKY